VSSLERDAGRKWRGQGKAADFWEAPIQDADKSRLDH
jgi:hypothetical protein